MSGFFFDTYALLRFHAGAPAYEPFARTPIITERTHLYEFAREVLKVEGAKAVLPALAGLRANEVAPTPRGPARGSQAEDEARPPFERGRSGLRPFAT